MTRSLVRRRLCCSRPRSCWRRLLLLPIALLASLAVVLLARTLAQTPDLDARWRLDATGHLQMIATDLPWMRPALGHSLEVIVAPGIAPPPSIACSLRCLTPASPNKKFASSRNAQAWPLGTAPPPPASPRVSLTALK